MIRMMANVNCNTTNTLRGVTRAFEDLEKCLLTLLPVEKKKEKKQDNCRPQSGKDNKAKRHKP